MHQQREDLDILFRRTAPEAVLKNIRAYTGIQQKKIYELDADIYTEEAYDHYSLLNLPEYSQTELQLRSEALRDSMKRIDNGGVFSNLILYADEIFHYDGEVLCCKAEKILSWRSIYLRLGQDIFTTAWLAWRQKYKYYEIRSGMKFTWPTVLLTDDRRLNEILEKGLADNHFHLHGSTQSFALSWSCLMNHPDYIIPFLNSNSRFSKDLSFHASKGVDDNVMGWEMRILYAAMIRALLFERCLGLMDATASCDSGVERTVIDEFNEFDRMPLASDVKDHTEMLRDIYGSRFKQISGELRCLDYACCDQFYVVDREENNRLLAGERNFLYQCFFRRLKGELSREESALFYLYLLIKSNFRGELVQLNGRIGFKNFADYQARKNGLFGKLEEYWSESLRLSICSGIEENHLVSLETRIMPGKSRCDMKKNIEDLDRRACYPVKERGIQLPFFYVIHFAKTPFSKKEYHKDERLILYPRNWTTRKSIRKQAKALDQYMHLDDWENQRIWGIDACSMEIGCRPETFATEFRYLRMRSRDNLEGRWYYSGENSHKEIGVTYHVGEDFLDIADGLRAIDEAIRFLELEKGDRLGHALALGINAYEYYCAKRYNVFLRKQDYLDNLVWLLYRSLELGVDISSDHRVVMQNKAMELFEEVFGEAFAKRGPRITDTYTGNILDAYYHSWMLRGDHPDLYESGEYISDDDADEEKYENYEIPGGIRTYKVDKNGLVRYRKDKYTAELYYLYHFDPGVKDKGYEVTGVPVEKWYIDLISDMQNIMRMEIYKNGICIECNPTSNILIGTFGQYSKHPILTFNHHYLTGDDEHPNLRVSINTDDLGVFDTSLNNEFAVMFYAVCRSRHDAGNFNDDAVYEYLDYLRLQGISMVFRKSS